MSENTIINKYRPLDFSEVIGHDSLVAALERVISSDICPHAFLFTGPAGCGKTTLARIVASKLECDLTEIDAASNSGTNEMRALIEMGEYQSFNRSRKLFLVDEFHGLSKQAMDVLLKTLEEPPPHLYFALCTTEVHKVKETIVSRCYHVPLRPVKDSEIDTLLTLVCDVEGWKPNNDVMQMIITSATGQPRKALSLLQTCWDAPSREEAQRIIALTDLSDPSLDLLRDIVNGKHSWVLIRPHLEKMEDEDFDSLLTGAARYITNAVMREKDEGKARKLWALLDALTFPTSTFDRKAAFMAAIGRMIWNTN